MWQPRREQPGPTGSPALLGAPQAAPVSPFLRSQEGGRKGSARTGCFLFGGGAPQIAHISLIHNLVPGLGLMTVPHCMGAEKRFLSRCGYLRAQLRLGSLCPEKAERENGGTFSLSL